MDSVRNAHVRGEQYRGWARGAPLRPGYRTLALQQRAHSQHIYRAQWPGLHQMFWLSDVRLHRPSSEEMTQSRETRDPGLTTGQSPISDIPLERAWGQERRGPYTPSHTLVVLLATEIGNTDNRERPLKCSGQYFSVAVRPYLCWGLYFNGLYWSKQHQGLRWCY